MLFAICCLSCKPPHSKRKFNPEALKLNDQAQTLLLNSGRTESDQVLKNAIILLNKAIQIDSNYPASYLNKFVFQNELKQYGNAIFTGKQLMKLRPTNVNIKLMVGEDYEKIGDTISSVKYYKDALAGYNKILDTMSVSNKTYSSFLSSKAFTLIMLHQQSQGYAILNEMAAKETDPNLKQMYLGFAEESRNDILYWKITETTNVTSEDPVKKK